MKQVVTINLGGNAYQLDEDGYQALGDYLDNARSRLAGNPDIEEIMSDLELAIADKAGRFLGPGKTVVSGAEVARIIDEMGPVDMPPGEETEAHASAPGTGESAARGGAAGAASAAGTGGEPGAAGTGGAAPRKLYRLTDGREKMLAGVCSGLAAYLGIDVSILRLACLLLAFASAGIALIAYIVAALVIPAAETPEQRAAAYGVPFDARDVLERARAKVSDFKNERQTWRQRRAEQRYRERQTRAGGQNLLSGLLAVVVIVFGIILALSLLLGFFRMIGQPVMLPAFTGYYRSPGWPGFLILVLALGLVLWLVGRPPADANRGFFGGLLVGTIQLFLAIALIWLAYHSFSFVRHVVDGTVMTVHHML